MDQVSWALYLLTAAAALAMVGYLYGRREMPGRGRRILAGLRWGALALLLLLLFDPEFSVPGLTGPADRTQVLLDGSLSMAVPLRAGEPDTRWSAAVEEARRVAGRGDVVVFGASPRVVQADSLAALVPDAASSQLAPALRAAAEAGKRRVLVLTDGGIEDLAAVNRLLPQLGMEVEVRSPGGEELPNRALAEVEAPGWAEAGKAFEVRVGVSAGGAAGDSIRVALREGDRVLAEGAVASPPPGRVATTVLSFIPEAPPEGGMVRYDVALEPGDAIPDDDVRSIYVYLDEKPAGVALVSFRPDWEPRFLQPVLEQALGLPVRGYLQAQAGRFIRVGSGGEAGTPIGEAEVRRAVERASIVVLHGLTADAPAWARGAARDSRRALVFPAGTNGIPDLPVTIAAPAQGDWFAAGELPASPVAEMLAGLRLDDLPPLASLRPATLPARSWAPLLAGRQRGGEAGMPVAAAHERGGRRTVVALADGFWRWAMRDGTPRETYRRLWSALGGWLLEDERMVDAGPVRPVSRVAPRGEAPLWVATGSAADSVTGDGTGGPAGAGAEAGTEEMAGPRDSVGLRVLDAAGTLVLDTTLSVAAGDTIATPVLAPGHYSYEARALAGSGGAGDVGGSGAAAGTSPGAGPEPVVGSFTVESYSPEYLRDPVAIAEAAAVAAEIQPPRQRGPGRPVHTEPWPYLAFVLLISTEWIFRRRWGLR